jgi:hypothetical protein
MPKPLVPLLSASKTLQGYVLALLRAAENCSGVSSNMKMK